MDSDQKVLIPVELAKTILLCTNLVQFPEEFKELKSIIESGVDDER